jgi:CubicO group peptidase (beta-lactamase class C family)
MYSNLSHLFMQATLWLLVIALIAGCTAIPKVVTSVASVATVAVGPAAAPVAAQPPAQVDLSNVQPQPVDATIVAELEAYIADVMQRTGVPGVAVGIVQNGEVVYQNGFGVRELGQPDPVTPDTQMMIGSTGKSMTAMMVASVVDDGFITWDTPVVEILPWFTLSDGVYTPQVTMRHLLCNCMGLQRRDIELFFTSNGLQAEDVVRSLRTYPMEGVFGETFGYINQAVATGGYAAAAAAGGSGDLYADYLGQMQARVFDPIGMTETTFSFEQVQANLNHAIPHGVTAGQTYVPMSIATERFLLPSAPAGASWSTVSDMTRYLITQMNRGIAPDGTRVVSAQNLARTWQPGVQASPVAHYGMGWAVSQYKGAPLLSHGGGTGGFSSFMAFLPDAKLGVIVLTNAGQSNAATRLPTAVTFRLFELVFGQPMEFDARFAAALAADDQGRTVMMEQIQPNADAVALAPYLGVYTNEALGEVTLALAEDKLTFDAGEVTSELRRIGATTYVLWDPPLAGPRIELSQDGAGRPGFVFDPHSPDAPMTYAFTKVR